jgi:hypothetical protein
MMEALRPSEMSVFTRATQRNNPEGSILHSHLSENIKSYMKRNDYDLYILSCEHWNGITAWEEMAVARQWHGKHPCAATIAHVTDELLSHHWTVPCFLCFLCWDYIKRIQTGASSGSQHQVRPTSHQLQCDLESIAVVSWVGIVG